MLSLSAIHSYFLSALFAIAFLISAVTCFSAIWKDGKHRKNLIGGYDLTKKNAPFKISSAKIHKNGHFLEYFTYFNTSNKKVKEKGEIQYMNKQIDIEEFKRRCENSEKHYISFTRRFNHG